MLDLDTFKWNNTELFKYLHQALPKDHGQTRNIVEVKEDMLFVWNEADKCLLSLNWRATMAKGAAVQYQVSVTNRNTFDHQWPTQFVCHPLISCAM